MMTTTRPKKPKLGRPARDKRSSEARLVARCTDNELAAATRAAEQLGVTVSDFVRMSVELAVKGMKL